MTIYRFNDFIFDSEALFIEGPGGRGELRNQVRQLFEMLLEAHPEVVGQEAIIAQVWPDTHVKETAVPQLILELRQALEQAGCERGSVATVPRKGYRWTLPFERGLPQPKRKRAPWIWLLLPLALLFLIWFWPGQPPKQSPETGVFTIAMMPFHNETGNPDLAWFELGFPDVISQILDQDKSLNAIPIADVLRQVKELKLDLGNAENRQTLRRALGVDLMIQTTIDQRDENYGLDFSFIQPDKPNDDWQVEVSRPWDVVPALAEGIRQRISLNLVLTPDSETMDLDAFTTQAYANGVHLLNGKAFAEARPYFEVVISRHPEHNRARIYLAQCALKMGDYDQCQEICEAMINAETSMPEGLRRSATHLLAELHFSKRDYAKSKAIAEPLVADIQENEDPDYAVKIYWLMGSICFSLAQKQEARSWYQRALVTSRQHQMLAAEATSLWYFASVNSFDQDNLPYLREALDIASALGNGLLRAKLLNAIALLIQGQGKFQEARNLLEEALEVRRDLQDKRGIGLGLLYLGNSESRFDTSKARSYFNQCIEIFQELEDAWNLINSYIYLSHLENIEGHFDTAIQQLDRAIAIARDANDQDAFYYITFNKVATELRRNDLGKARHYIAQIRAEEALPPHKASGAMALEALCDYLAGHFDEALKKMTEAKTIGGNAWHQGFERYHDILVQAQAGQRHKPLPFEDDPIQWIFE